ncbi:MAG TPA: ABC transporter permease [Candidatus Saccharimonadales bacterium]
MDRVKAILSKQNRALLSELVRTDFKLRYQDSFLGYLWSLLRPLLMFAILYIVFVKVFPLGKGIPHYPVYLFAGMVLWNFFTEMTGQSLGSIVGRGDLIRKIRIPRWMIVFSSSLSALINLGLNLIVLIIFMVLSKVSPMDTLGLAAPLLIEMYLLALGVSMFLSAAFVKYRDLTYIWEVILQAGFYITPILYPLSRIHNVAYQKILLLNPAAQTIQDFRYSVVTHDKSVSTVYRLFDGGWHMYIPMVLVVLILVGGILYFKSQANSFAENI